MRRKHAVSKRCPTLSFEILQGFSRMMSLPHVSSRAASTPRHGQALPRMRLSDPLATTATGSRFSGTSARGRQGGRGFVQPASSASGARVTQVPPALPAEKPGSSVVFFFLPSAGRGFRPVPSRPLVITGAMNKKKKPFLGMPAPLGYVPGLGRG